jgi:PBP1b-binding outer membrane lipoprotein LpoB
MSALVKYFGTALIALFLLGGCEQEGPAESAGEEIDEATEETQESLEEAGEELEE